MMDYLDEGHNYSTHSECPDTLGFPLRLAC